MSILNGRLIQSLLSKTSNGHTLRKAARDSYERLNKAFKAEFGYELKLTQGYRTYAQQESIFRLRYRRTYATINGIIDRRIWKGVSWWRYRGAAAAVPGTSNHGLGIAIDISTSIGFRSFTSTQFKWLAANGPRYGWTNTEGRSVNEPWHWVYNAKTDRMKPKPATKKTEIQKMAAKLPVIKPGAKGTYVGRMQGLLLAAGYTLGRAGLDRDNGPSTQKALEAFQRKNKLTPDKICGPATWAKLLGA